MRAFVILVFLVSFNAGLYMMGELGVFVPTGHLISLPAAITISVAALAIGAAGTTVLGTNISTPTGIAVGIFAAFYVLMYTEAFNTLYGFMINQTPLIPGVILTTLTLINAVAVIAGILQMVTGGWRGHR